MQSADPIFNVTKGSPFKDIGIGMRSPRKPYERSVSPSRWTQEEHQRWVDFLKKYGRDWKNIEHFMGGTKSEQQCRTRGIILLQKLKENCYDDDLYRVLAGKNYGKEYIKRSYNKRGHRPVQLEKDANANAEDEYDSMDVRKDVKSLLIEAKDKNFPDLIPNVFKVDMKRQITIIEEDDKKDVMNENCINIDDEYILQDEEKSENKPGC